MTLSTPLGTIYIEIDSREIAYEYKRIELDRTCPDVDGRYLITLNYQPDGNSHIIACRIRGYQPSAEDEIETGEYLELKSFYNGTIKLSIGMIGQTGYVGSHRDSAFDYDNGYLVDGVTYELLPFTKTQKYKFAIAWLNHCTSENDVQTWLAADPIIL